MTNFFDRVDAVTLPHVARPPLADWIPGTISAPIALLTLMNLLQQPTRVRAALEPLLEQMRVFGGPHEREKAAQMDGLLARLPSALENIGALLELERDHQRPWSGGPGARYEIGR